MSHYLWPLLVALSLVPSLWFPAGMAQGRTEVSVPANAQFLRELLLDRYEAEPEDPDYIRSDLSAMAAYYAKFPEVVEIFESVDEHEWLIRYQGSTWTTRPQGSPVRLRGLIVFFDPRTGGQVIKHRRCEERPICRLSPADTFLHEMLHVRTILLEFDKYVSQGGMSKAIYPLQHEYDVIRQERELLKRLSAQDGRERPSRTQHRGETISVACPTCTQ